MIYLASKSPRRTELLSQIGVEHEIIDIEVDEIIDSNQSTQENVRALSVLKCQEGIRKVIAEEKSAFPVLTADTIVVFEGKIFGKPASESDAIRMLMQLSGKTHSVITGVTIGVISSKQEKFHTLSVESSVEFTKFDQDDCLKYCKTNEPFDKAGGYGIQGIASSFIPWIGGSYTGIVGLPLTETIGLLSTFGYSVYGEKNG